MRYSPVQFYQNLLDLPMQDRPKVMVYSEERKSFLGSLNSFEVSIAQELSAHLCPLSNLNK